jgi:hypothetical protein
MSSSENILHVSPERPIRRSMCAFGQFRERPVGKLPWGQVCTRLDQVKDPALLDWYADRDARNGWSRPILEHHAATGPHQRIRAAPSNFGSTWTPPTQTRAGK